MDDPFTRDVNAQAHLDLLKWAMSRWALTQKDRDLCMNELWARKRMAASPLVDFWFDPLIDAIPYATNILAPP